MHTTTGMAGDHETTFLKARLPHSHVAIMISSMIRRANRRPLELLVAVLISLTRNLAQLTLFGISWAEFIHRDAFILQTIGSTD